MISEFFRAITGIKAKDDLVHQMKNEDQAVLMRVQKRAEAVHSTAYRVAKATGRIE